MGKADIGGKQTINIYNWAWAEWVLQQQHIQVEAELSSEFQFITRAADSLLQVSGEEGQFLVLTELQFRYDEAMPDRLTAYAALARQKYKRPVFVTVVYLFPPPAGVTLESAFHQEFMGQLAHQDFQVIALWELDAEQVLGFENPALLPFIPLMRGGDTEQIVRQCAERIRQEAGETELEAILSVFAGYVLDPEIVKQILRWEMTVVKESPIMQELREEWLAKGIEQGIEQGERKATLEALRQTLTIRFKVDRNKFDAPFARLAVVSLKKLNEVALTAQTLTAFEEALTEMLSPPEKPAPPSNEAPKDE